MILRKIVLGFEEGIDEYQYLKNIIDLWPGYWEDYLNNMNKMVHKIKNCIWRKYLGSCGSS